MGPRAAPSMPANARCFAGARATGSGCWAARCPTASILWNWCSSTAGALSYTIDAGRSRCANPRGATCEAGASPNSPFAPAWLRKPLGPVPRLLSTASCVPACTALRAPERKTKRRAPHGKRPASCRPGRQSPWAVKVSRTLEAIAPINDRSRCRRPCARPDQPGRCARRSER